MKIFECVMSSKLLSQWPSFFEVLMAGASGESRAYSALLPNWPGKAQFLSAQCRASCLVNCLPFLKCAVAGASSERVDYSALLPFWVSKAEQVVLTN
jgi:hypothetical protein